MDAAAPSQEHKSGAKKQSAVADLLPRKRRLVPYSLIGADKNKHVGAVKKKKRAHHEKRYSGRFSDELDEADKLEEKVKKVLNSEIDKKRLSSARAAMAMLSATRKMLERNNN